jgi:hypothetical protein
LFVQVRALVAQKRNPLRARQFRRNFKLLLV